MTTYRFLRDSGQVEPGDSDIFEEEILIRQIINGDVEDVKACLRCLIKDNLKKKMAASDGSALLMFKIFQAKQIKLVLQSKSYKELIDNWSKRQKSKHYLRTMWQQLLVSTVSRIKNKTKSFDLFWSVKLGEQRMYKQTKV